MRRALRLARLDLVLPILALSVVFAALNADFARRSNLELVLTSLAFVGLVALGETILIIGGEFDLSVGAVAGLASVVAALGFVDHGLGALGGLVLALGVGFAAGCLNAFLTIVVGVPSFITTIGTLYIASGLATTLTNGEPIYDLPSALTSFSVARPLGLSWPFLIFVVLVVLAQLALTFSAVGRAVYATGGSREVARLAGINTKRVKAGCFAITGLLTGLAGYLQMGALATAQPTLGTGWELTAIAAVVIGGTSIFGGVGTAYGTLLGLVLVTVVTSGLVSSNVPPNWQTLAVGLIMIAAIGVDVARRRLRLAIGRFNARRAARACAGISPATFL